MSEGRRVREWSEYEWKIRNQLLVGTTGGISSQAFGRRRLGFSLASPVLEIMDVALGFGFVQGLVAQEGHED